MPDGFFAFSTKKGKINTLSPASQQPETVKSAGDDPSAFNIWYWPFWAKTAIVLSILLPFIAYLIINMLSTISLDKYQSGGQSNKESQMSTQTNIENISNWKTYSNTEANFSLQYPPLWILFIEPKKPGDTSQKAVLKGKEGDITILWGSGFGGGCPTAEVDVPIKNMVLKACHTQSGESEVWGGLSYEKNNVSYYVDASVRAPIEQNRDAVLKVLSTLEF